MDNTLSVTEWIDWQDADQKPQAVPGFGGFFKEGMRWRDYLGVFDAKYHPYYEVLRQEILSKNIRITGKDHQYMSDAAPVFSDGTAGCFSYRGWGDLMAAVWSEQENKNYHYMNFYM